MQMKARPLARVSPCLEPNMAAAMKKVVLGRLLSLSRVFPVVEEYVPLAYHQHVRLYKSIVEKATPDVDLSHVDEEFRVLIIPGHTKVPDFKRRTARKRQQVRPPRSLLMKTDQDWTNVWPTASTFKASAVPFPVTQGAVEGEENDGMPMKKEGNTELLKIPNFLHLTPNHIKKHCAALKQFCTPWPEGLETEEDCEKHFPIETILRDYLTDSPSLSDSRARLVTLKIKLSALSLDYHAKDKFLRLVGDRYDPSTDELTLNTDRCPTKKQNYEYSLYLLTALYHESWTTAPWESEKTVADMEKYVWDINPSKTTLVRTLQSMKKAVNTEGCDTTAPGYLSELSQEIPEDDRITSLSEINEYKDSVELIHNEGENVQNWNRYKESVKRLILGIA